MKKILGDLRRADQDFSLISNGDHVLVGVSGGKDSLMLLAALALYRQFSPNRFSLSAVTVDMGIGNMDFGSVAALAQKLDVPYSVKRTEIGEIVFTARSEKNPCALCSRMRRGALLEYAAEIGANSLALGHHRDDAIETLLLSVLYEGRMHTFHPKTVFSDRGIKQIRPLAYVPEGRIAARAKALELPVAKSPCPVDGGTKRTEMKALMDTICAYRPDAREMALRALMNDKQYSLWEKSRGDEPNEG